MYTETCTQLLDETDRMKPFASLPLALAVEPDIQLYRLLADLSHDTPWPERQRAARALGRSGDPQALPGLLDALPSDPFWKVRCDIIQAMEMIGDPASVPVLQKVASYDGFEVVRSYARKAVERLTVEEQHPAG